VDAFRLMAMFLNHWDNKPSNQRLICTKRARSDGSACDEILAIIQDAGSTFGPKKADLRRWSESPVWIDAPGCVVGMKHLPRDGATFQQVRISEPGRRLLVDRLMTLTSGDVAALFTNAGFDEVAGWVAAFQHRVAVIAERPPCAVSSQPSHG
jgi:hypothetical protein